MKHKLVTYPRTDSEYLTENQIGDVQNVLRSHKLYFSEVNVISDISNNSAFNNAKVTDRHAVILQILSRTITFYQNFLKRRGIYMIW